MKHKFTQREEAIGHLHHKKTRRIITHKALIKYKLVGHVHSYYKYPPTAKALWVTPELWELKTRWHDI